MMGIGSHKKTCPSGGISEHLIHPYPLVTLPAVRP